VVFSLQHIIPAFLKQHFLHHNIFKARRVSPDIGKPINNVDLDYIPAARERRA
jgi:hypothetical protein